MYALLDAIGEQQTATNILFQGVLSLPGQLFTLRFISLVYVLHDRIRATLRRHPHMARLKEFNALQNAFHTISRGQVIVIP